MNRVDYPSEIKELVAHLKRLPGIGPKSAERIAIWMLGSRSSMAGDLADAIHKAESGVTACGQCGFFTGVGADCLICGDSEREAAVVCVVEQATDVLPLERTGAFRGQYHCLGGKISPLENVAPDDLRIDALYRRMKEKGFTEVILAVGSDVEGEATANYLAEMLGMRFEGISVTRLAQGLPAGGGLEHADELTLFRALSGRRSMES
ncbi:MAG: recombination protein RecR [Verrucomicrobiales bacterium]